MNEHSIKNNIENDKNDEKRKIKNFSKTIHSRLSFSQPHLPSFTADANRIQQDSSNKMNKTEERTTANATSNSKFQNYYNNYCYSYHNNYQNDNLLIKTIDSHSNSNLNSTENVKKMLFLLNQVSADDKSTNSKKSELLNAISFIQAKTPFNILEKLDSDPIHYKKLNINSLLDDIIWSRKSFKIEEILSNDPNDELKVMSSF
jgi:hypothetical protein